MCLGARKQNVYCLSGLLFFFGWELLTIQPYLQIFLPIILISPTAQIMSLNYCNSEYICMAREKLLSTVKTDGFQAAISTWERTEQALCGSTHLKA